MVEDDLGTAEDSGASGRKALLGRSRVPPAQGRKWSVLSEADFESACLLAARGVDTETIAAVLAEKPTKVARAIRSPKGKQRIRKIRGSEVLLEVTHQDRMRDMLPVARQAILDGIRHAQNSKNAADVGRWIHEAVIAKPAQKHEHKIEGRIEHDLTPVFDKILGLIETVKEVREGRPDPLRRVISGHEAMAQRKALPSGE